MYRNKNDWIIVKISYDDDSTLDFNSNCDSSHQNVKTTWSKPSQTLIQIKQQKQWFEFKG